MLEAVLFVVGCIRGGTLSSTNYATVYTYMDSAGGGAAATVGSTFMTIALINTTTANIGCTGHLQFFPAGGYSSIVSNFILIQNTSVVSNSFFQCGTVGNATAANGIRFGANSMGNLTGGNFRLYGIKNS